MSEQKGSSEKTNKPAPEERKSAKPKRETNAPKQA